mmetsp:Transcript_19353/g.36541  ORF Transcript_19353/g.36541 Transcript_19353/m.36541 type:complete len:92 (-) Transcript_19353:260-535(-)
MVFPWHPSHWKAVASFLNVWRGMNVPLSCLAGTPPKKEVENKKTLLLDKLQNDNDWMPANDDPPVLAQYNDPFTPPWKRLNEVSVAVKSRS